MLFLFFHDHKFRFDGSRYYSTGGLGEAVLKKYISENDEIYVFARVIPLSKNEEISAITDKRIHIVPFVRGTYKEYIKKADYCIFRLPSWISVCALRFAKKYNKRYLVEVVGSAKDSYMNHGTVGKMLAHFFERVTKKEVKEAKYVTYVTQKYLQRAYPNSNSNVGVSDVQIEQAEDEVLKNRVNKINEISDNKYIIGTVGNYSVKYKSQETIIRALGELKRSGNTNYKYYLVGSGNREYLENIVKEECIEDAVTFLGAIPHENIFEFYDKIDIYAQPSLLEGLCRSVVEAMSRGCPCILSDVGGNVELVEKQFRFNHGKDAINQINDILLNYDKNCMIQAATRNFEESKKYSKDYLDNVWKNFYQCFLEDGGNEN